MGSDGSEGVNVHRPTVVVEVGSGGDEGLRPCSQLFPFVSVSKEIKASVMRIKGGRM
jgi:hypothetical protein